MSRFVALVEFRDGGGYWISFPGMDKTYRWSCCGIGWRS